MQSLVKPGSQAEQVGRLILAGVVVIALPALPFGAYLIYPLVILTTWFHEMGHGMTALLLGQQFVQLELYADGSGLAISRIRSDSWPFTRAAIAAGGPLAPTLVGAGLIVASAHEKWWRPVLWGMAIAIFASIILYVRSVVGFAVLPLVAATLVLIAWRAPPALVRFTLQFLGVLGAMSMVADFDYLFSEATPRGLSDTGQIEAALLLPHWVWATLILGVSVVIIGAALKYALSDKRRLPPARPLPANVLQFRRGPKDR